ncbi:hypothetical protein OSB04_un000745 [Centaurea solstitialis]|nr:hypothetical protein OSB04_un000745 [Centaurea solstitialis]
MRKGAASGRAEWMSERCHAMEWVISRVSCKTTKSRGAAEELRDLLEHRIGRFAFLSGGLLTLPPLHSHSKLRLLSKMHCDFLFCGRTYDPGREDKYFFLRRAFSRKAKDAPRQVPTVRSCWREHPHLVIGPLVHANPKKLSRTSHMQGNLHVCGSGRAFLRYLITLLLLAAGAPLLTIAHLFWNNLFRRDNFTYFCQILLLLSTAGTISMCFDSSEQERFDASESIVLIPLPTRSMLFMISAYDSIAMYLAIEPQSLCFYVIAASKRKSEFSTEAGSKYLILGAFSSGILLFGYDRTTTDIY